MFSKLFGDFLQNLGLYLWRHEKPVGIQVIQGKTWDFFASKM
jgi:hypothetical protein